MPEWFKAVQGSEWFRLVLVMAGGAVGTAVRYELGRRIDQFGWAPFGSPYGTLIINVSGSFILGVAFVVIRERLPRSYDPWLLLVGTGFCGGYTTFSTFELETFKLVRDDGWALALANVTLSVVGGFLAVVLAFALVNLVWPKP